MTSIAFGQAQILMQVNTSFPPFGQVDSSYKLLLWSLRFSMKGQERERSGERNPLVEGNVNLTIML